MDAKSEKRYDRLVDSALRRLLHLTPSKDGSKLLCLATRLSKPQKDVIPIVTAMPICVFHSIGDSTTARRSINTSNVNGFADGWRKRGVQHGCPSQNPHCVVVPISGNFNFFLFTIDPIPSLQKAFPEATVQMVQES